MLTIALLPFLLSLSGSPNLDTVYVDHNADCAISDGSAAAPFCTIEEGLQAVNEDGTVLLASGHYIEGVTIDKSIVLRAMDATDPRPVIDGAGPLPAVHIVEGVTATIDSVVLTGASAFGVSAPAVIDLMGSLVLRNSIIRDAWASGQQARIVNAYAATAQTLTIESCVIRDNLVHNAIGGDIMVLAGVTVWIKDSWLTDNMVYNNAGALILSSFASITIDGTTISGNRTFAAPNIEYQSSHFLMRNSTISDNQGMALYVDSNSTSMRLEHCTIVDNLTYGLAGPTGISAINNQGTSRVELKDCVIAAFLNAPGLRRTVAGHFTSLGHNVIDNVSGSSGIFNNQNGDQAGGSSSILDPGMGPLQELPGVLGRFHVPLAVGRARDAGSQNVDVDLALDQVGFPRVPGGADVGAIEAPVDVGLVGCSGYLNSTGAGAELAVSGSLDVARNSVRLLVSSAPSNAPSVFITSQTDAWPTVPVGSQGVICLGGSIGRFVGPGQVQQTSPTGTMQLDLDLTSLPQPNGAESAIAGQSWYFQAWFRDVVGGQSTSNFSSAAALFWE